MRKTALASILLVLVSMLTFIEANSSDDSADIKRQVATYYSYEKAKKWEKTYELRTPDFRALVPLDTYVETMRRDSQGWQLKEFTAIEVNKKGNRAVVKMRFVEEPPADFLTNIGPTGAQPKPKMREMAFMENTVWLSIGGIWHCAEAGSRMHLSLNHAVSADMSD